MICQKYAMALRAVLVFGLMGGSSAGRTQLPTPPAQFPTPPVGAREEKNDVSFLRVMRHEEVTFPRAPARTLHTWYMESRGAGMVEARVWFIADGRTTLRDQCVLWWDNKMPTELWRLQMLEQAAPKPTLLPSYELTAIFDNPAGRPNTTAAGAANSDARRTEQLLAAFNAVFTTNTSNAGGIPVNRPFLFYAAQLRPPFGDTTAMRIMRGDDPNPVETLTKQSRTPGKAFLVLSVLWKPAPSKPTPSN